MRNIVALLSLGIFSIQAFAVSKKEDLAPREGLFESKFGIVSSDPYRWMENPDDPALTQWLDKQNQASERYLGGETYSDVEQELFSLTATRQLAAPNDKVQEVRNKLQEWEQRQSKGCKCP